MKVVIADRIAPAGVDFLKRQPGFQVVEAYGSASDVLKETLRDAVAIVVRSETQVTRELMASGPLLRIIGRAGVGIDNIDVPAATERGIVVVNTPSGNTTATAELTFAHLMCAARPIVQACSRLKQGSWDRKAFAGSELSGKTLGILGFGRIGYEVAKRARVFGMHVLTYDPYILPERAKGVGATLVELDFLLSEADYISIHMPLLDGTRHFIDKKAFAKMKPGVRLVNCARGGIVDEAALTEAMQSGKVAACGMDVFEREPLDASSELLGLDASVLTPHLGASTAEAQESVGIEVAEVISRALLDGHIVNAVNMPSIDPETLARLAPYLDLGQRLGSMMQQLTASPLETLKITYSGKLAETDTRPIDRAIQRGYARNICGEAVNDVNAPLKLKERGVTVEIIASSSESEYTELIELEGYAKGTCVHTLAGTLFGKGHTPRLVRLDHHTMEVVPEGSLLILENRDIPGIVGMLGSLLAKHRINIANLSLSRSEPGVSALSVFSLDESPSAKVLDEIALHEAISKVHCVHC
ncbi:MAG TPA: phosphoglycerate dehydrogenase [Opitutae bacterium]|nr:phosphoglycerate dehydrogenase [Opitutae bacterium]|tara:strand:- start:357 stop:1946 length:1590 start_codon:yes stop_codon:yes gene_type:complete